MFNQVVHNSPANDESKAFRFQMFWKFWASARVIEERKNKNKSNWRKKGKRKMEGKRGKTKN